MKLTNVYSYITTVQIKYLTQQHPKALYVPSQAIPSKVNIILTYNTVNSFCLFLNPTALFA